MHLKKLYTDL